MNNHLANESYKINTIKLKLKVLQMQQLTLNMGYYPDATFDQDRLRHLEMIII
jgi:hypothetical protein